MSHDNDNMMDVEWVKLFFLLFFFLITISYVSRLLSFFYLACLAQCYFLGLLIN